MVQPRTSKACASGRPCPRRWRCDVPNLTRYKTPSFRHFQLKGHMPGQELAVAVDFIERRIYLLRGQKVMLDRDLAEQYGVETRALIQAVKRNIKRFPKDFMFKLSASEASALRSQIVILDNGRGQYPNTLHTPSRNSASPCCPLC